MTRTTTAHLFSSVNGVVESPHLFQFDAFGPEEGEMMGQIIGNVTDVVIGRGSGRSGRSSGRPPTTRSPPSSTRCASTS